MIKVIENVDKLIIELDKTDFIKKMKELKEVINDNKLINTNDIKLLYKDHIIHEYIKNQNILDLHIYYLNNRLKEITESRKCK